MPRHFEDFTGKTINGILIKYPVNESGGSGKHKKWVCECPQCHKEYITQSNHIKTNISSVCAECSRVHREDLSGQKYGHLTVDFMINPGKYKRTKCSCTCDCGSTGVIVQANHIKDGSIKSCGCMISYPEEFIAHLLSINDVEFNKQKSFPGLRYINPLRCDFYLPYTNTVLEYNGEQHYKPIEYYGGVEGYHTIIKRDQAKREYCRENNINFLVIRFDDNIEEFLIQNNIIKKR